MSRATRLDRRYAKFRSMGRAGQAFVDRTDFASSFDEPDVDIAGQRASPPADE
jgi:hypothetical protein